MAHVVVERRQRASMIEPAVVVKGLVHMYPGRGEPALVIDELVIGEGEVVLVTGKSGSGKSTLVNCINGVIPHLFPGDSNLDPSTHSGEVYVRGLAVSKTPLHILSTVVGTLLQDPETQVLNYDIEEEVAFGPENLCLPPDEVNRRVSQAISSVGIGHLLGRETYTLSGGELQRVAAAAILAMTPQVLIFDEPTSNVDPEGTAVLLDFIRSLKGKSVIIVEHKVERILPFADRVILMDNGRIVVDTPASTLLDKVDVFIQYGVEIPESYEYAKMLGLNTTDVQQLADEIRKRGVPIDQKMRRKYTQTILEAHLRVFSGERELLDAEISLGSGHILGVMGRNGAGKSTLLKALMGVLDRKLQSDVHLSVCGVDLSKANVSERGRYITYVPQNFDLTLVSRSVMDELSYSPKKRGLKDWRDRVNELMGVLSLEEYSSSDPFALSFGQRRRVALGSALAAGVKVALLDEPTSGQDFAHREALGRELSKLAGLGYSFIVVTHDSRFVYRHCDRLAILSEGRIVLEGTPEKVFEHSEDYGIPPPTEFYLWRRLSER
jgi:energy-coupling factor transporter ATP-binding protein EcfA2